MNRDKSVAVGVEIAGGGTTIALVDRHGQIRHRLYAKTLLGRPATATFDPYLRAIAAMLAHAHLEGLDVRGIGVSVPGVLDQTSRRPFVVPTLPSLNGFPICDLLEARYKLPACLHVDVDASLLGEAFFGVGRGFQRLLFLRVNAVVGAALAVDGRLEGSEEQYIGHACHLVLSPAGAGVRCSCGKRGCINTLVSIDALQRMVQRALRRGEQTSLIQRLGPRECLSFQLLAEEALQGDSIALGICNEISRWLGAAASKYIQIFEPHRLILGGSILGAGGLLLTQIRNVCALHAATEAGKRVEIVPALLGNNASLVGAVAPFFSSATLLDAARATYAVGDTREDGAESEQAALLRRQHMDHQSKRKHHVVIGDSKPLVAETPFSTYPYPDDAHGASIDMERPEIRMQSH